MTATTFDQQMQTVIEGRRLSAPEIAALAEAPDVLTLGMLADVARRRRHGSTVTYVRVARCPVEGSFTDLVPPAAREVRIVGTPASLDIARSAVRSAKAVAGDRVVSAFAWADVMRLSQATGMPELRVLQELRAQGLDQLGELALDAGTDADVMVETMKRAGYDRLRLTVQSTPLAGRLALFELADAVQQRHGCVHSLDPLPTVVSTFRPTTGYEDVKTVAVARLVAPQVSSIQIDWLKYGPKLAQVGLTFGADDLYGVDSSDDAPEGRRRAPLEEVRRNIQAAGFTPIERDGRFNALA